MSNNSVPRPSSYPLLGPKYLLLGTIYPQLRAQGGSWYLEIVFMPTVAGRVLVKRRVCTRASGSKNIAAIRFPQASHSHHYLEVHGTKKLYYTSGLITLLVIHLCRLSPNWTYVGYPSSKEGYY